MGIETRLHARRLGAAVVLSSQLKVGERMKSILNCKYDYLEK